MEGNNQKTLTIEPIELDIDTFYDLGLSQAPGYSRERVIACLRACKNFTTEALDNGLVENHLQSSISPDQKNLFRQELRLD
jgi:hypothetical protein